MPPRPNAAASVTRQANNTAAIDLRDIPEIEPEDDQSAEQVSAESLAPHPSTTGALLGQAPEISLFAAPAQAVVVPTPVSLERVASPASSGVPASIAPTVSDLDVINFAQQARRGQPTRVLLALAAVAIVGVGVGVTMQEAPASGALQAPRTSAALAKPPMPSGQPKELAHDVHQPMTAPTHSAVQGGSDVLGRAPLAAPVADAVTASTATSTKARAPRLLVRRKNRSETAASEPQPGAEASPAAATSPVAVEGGPSWLVRAQQREAAEASSERSR